MKNATPEVPAIAAAEIAHPSRPYVIKLHAQWCPICMMTKTVWRDIETVYGPRVNLVVFDFTNQTTTEASRSEAARLGLGQFFEDNEGWTGTIAVLDGPTKQERAVIHGSRDFEEYRAAIDAVLE